MPRPTFDSCLEIPSPHVAQREAFCSSFRPQFRIKEYSHNPGSGVPSCQCSWAARPNLGETLECGEEVFPGP